MPSQFHARIPELRANLLTLYQQANDAELRSGLEWYGKAHRIVCEWAEEFSRPIANVACIVSAISPQCDWSRNLVIAGDILHNNPPSIGGALHSCLRKAKRIRDDRATNITEYFPQGPKVASFAACLAGDRRFPTIDTHMMQASLNDVKANYTLKWCPYTDFAQACIDAALHTCYQPAEFQAIVWHVWKRLHPRVNKIRERSRW
jgi:hypothetical protein